MIRGAGASLRVMTCIDMTIRFESAWVVFQNLCVAERGLTDAVRHIRGHWSERRHGRLAWALWHGYYLRFESDAETDCSETHP